MKDREKEGLGKIFERRIGHCRGMIKIRLKGRGKEMSCTEIYGFIKDGNMVLLGRIQDAFLGAFKIWGILEDKYLPPYIPHTSTPPKKINLDYTPSRLDYLSFHEILDLRTDKRLSREERIVLLSTFDNVLIKRENIPTLTQAFNSFDDETSLKEQVLILEETYMNKNIVAFGWNQVAIGGDFVAIGENIVAIDKNKTSARTNS